MFWSGKPGPDAAPENQPNETYKPPSLGAPFRPAPVWEQAGAIWGRRNTVESCNGALHDRLVPGVYFRQGASGSVSVSSRNLQ